MCKKSLLLQNMLKFHTEKDLSRRPFSLIYNGFLSVLVDQHMLCIYNEDRTQIAHCF